MRTDDLIQSLAGDVTAVSPRAVGVRLTGGLAVGGAVALAAVIAWLGLRPDLAEAAGGFTFWMKAAYTAAILLIGLALTDRLARPVGDPGRRPWLVLAPVAALALLALFELARTPSEDWRALWLGSSWRECPWRVLALALPVYLGLVWAFRRFAPTRPRLAGVAAGLTAGAAAATVYGLHCAESSALFVVTWYSLGIGLAGLVGLVTGPRLLRW